MGSSSLIAKRLQSSIAFWKKWLRQPALDVAESSMRLRRLRGLSQAQLAAKMKTQQPAVARLESARGNPRLSTLVELAEALGATVRVEMSPIERILTGPRTVPWWNVATGSEPSDTHRFTQVVIIQNTVIAVNNLIAHPIALEPMKHGNATQLETVGAQLLLPSVGARKDRVVEEGA